MKKSKRQNDNQNETLFKHWWAVEQGQSPHKTLGLGRDEERNITHFCTARRVIHHEFPQLKNDGAELPGYYQKVIQLIDRNWPEISAAEREALMTAMCAPDFSPPAGFSTFPYDEVRKTIAAVLPATPPDPTKLHGSKFTAAAEAYCLGQWKAQQNGWRSLQVNASCRDALHWAAAYLKKLEVVPVATDFTADKTIDQAKQESVKAGTATVTVKKHPARRLGFDDWTRQVESFDADNRVTFPLYSAIKESLRGFTAVH